jgi:cytidylate kinase
VTLAPAHPLVTISAPYGAGGSVVGPKVAERLGVPFVDRAIPVSVSRRLDVPLDDAITHEELPRDALSRWAAYFAPAVQLFGGTLAGGEPMLDDETFRAATEEVLREHAQGGGVILGRAGAIVLRDVPGALHVRLSAPRERRVGQAMRLSGVDRDTAERELRSSDVAREAYVKVWYRVDPGDPGHYHLVIDSTRIDLDCCVELIATVATHGRLADDA